MLPAAAVKPLRLCLFCVLPFLRSVFLAMAFCLPVFLSAFPECERRSRLLTNTNVLFLLNLYTRKAHDESRKS